mgnify:CR=1 FL=1
MQMHFQASHAALINTFTYEMMGPRLCSYPYDDRDEKSSSALEKNRKEVIQQKHEMNEIEV